jgi:SpoU rRNA methylase family enzyme
LPDTNILIISIVFSLPSLLSSEKKGIEQPKKKRRKTGKKKIIFSDLNEAYESLKNERTRARESNYSENSEDNMRSL